MWLANDLLWKFLQLLTNKPSKPMAAPTPNNNQLEQVIDILSFLSNHGTVILRSLLLIVVLIVCFGIIFEKRRSENMAAS